MAEYAQRCEAAGIDQLWVVEDCFWSASVSLAAAALVSTDRCAWGSVCDVSRFSQPAITAMEIATIAGLVPGRIILGMGHGFPEWMDKIGARPQSSMRALE